MLCICKNKFISLFTVLRDAGTVLTLWTRITRFSERVSGSPKINGKRHSKWQCGDLNGNLLTPELWITMLWNHEMHHIFSPLCLKINGYSHNRQGKRRRHLPRVTCGLFLQQLDTARSPLVTVKFSWTWEFQRVPTFSFYNNQTLPLGVGGGHPGHPLAFSDSWDLLQMLTASAFWQSFWKGGSPRTWDLWTHCSAWDWM